MRRGQRERQDLQIPVVTTATKKTPRNSEYWHRYHTEEEEGAVGMVELVVSIPLENFHANGFTVE